MKTEFNPAICIFNMTNVEKEKIRARHVIIQTQVENYIACGIPTIDDAILKEFAFRYATSPNRENNFLGSMLQIAEDLGNDRLFEAIAYIIEYVSLNSAFLGEAFSKRPDAFSREFVQAINVGDYSRRNDCLLKFANKTF